MTPFILKNAKRIQTSGISLDDYDYDPDRQIWIDPRNNLPLVISTLDNPATHYGETTITETMEGVDQPESHSLLSSQYGETTITKTAEGVDQTEITALQATRYGETTITATVEGVDRPERAVASEFDLDAPHSHF